MSKKEYKLTQDNGSCNDFNKITVKISESDLVTELKKFFRWRKDVTYDRLMSVSSRDYDRFIKHLSEVGY